MPAAFSRSVDPLELDTAPAILIAARRELVDEEIDGGAGADAEHFARD